MLSTSNYSDFGELNWTKLPKVLRIYTQHLLSLNLTGNNLRSFDFGSMFLRNDRGLQHLYLRSNSLNSLTNVRKITLSSLKSINVSKNNLTNICNIPWATFTDNLMTMDFSWNNIKILKTTCFKGLKKLTYLFMEGNSLVEVQTESFFYTPKIEHIRSTRLYLCCMVPASIQTCYPLRKYDGLSTCDGLLSHVTLQMYIWLV
ncbi:Relaxin receptor 1, partial [Trichoplax sp. H2]